MNSRERRKCERRERRAARRSRRLMWKRRGENALRVALIFFKVFICTILMIALSLAIAHVFALATLGANADGHPEYGSIIYSLDPNYGKVSQKDIDEGKRFLKKYGKDSGWQPVGNAAEAALEAACPVVPAVLVTDTRFAVGYSTPNLNGKHDRSACPLCYAAYTNDPIRVKMATISADNQRELHWKADAAARLAPEQIVLHEEVVAARKAFVAAPMGKVKQEARERQKEAVALWKERRKAPRITVTIRTAEDGREVYVVHHPDGVDEFYGDLLTPSRPLPSDFKRPRVTIQR